MDNTRCYDSQFEINNARGKEIESRGFDKVSAESASRPEQCVVFSRNIYLGREDTGGE